MVHLRQIARDITEHLVKIKNGYGITRAILLARYNPRQDELASGWVLG
jgi:hypothetical protein